ncbi:MAG TPA: VanW family protein [Polyangiaceae bacterium]|nr:VanW family protein [Polyangiaceae bacterium]
MSESSENEESPDEEHASESPQTVWSRVSPRRLGVSALVLLVTLLLGAFVSDELLGSGLPRGTRALGLELSHWSLERAAHDLESRIGVRARSALDVDIAGKHFQVLPADAGLKIDVRASLTRALNERRSKNVIARLGAWLPSVFGNGQELDWQVAVDAVRLEAKLAELEKASLELPFPGGFRREQGKIVPDYPRAGQRLERTQARARLQRALGLGERALSLPTVRAEPSVTRATIDRLVESAAALGRAEVVLSDAESARQLTLSPSELTQALRVAEPERPGEEPKIQLDGEALLEGLGERRAQVEQEAKAARFQIDATDHVEVVPSQVERRLSPTALAAAALSAARDASRTGPLPLERRSEPPLTSEQARALGIRGLVSKFTTRHPCCERRVENIHRIADLLNGLLVKPGETLSVNAVVGPRTTKNGFVPAPTIEEGEMVETIGGGISQFATTMFNALFHGGYDIIERQPHTYWFTRYPMGHEATLSYPKPDLIFKNDTEAGMLFDMKYDKTSITVRIFGDNGGRKVEAKVSPRQNIVKPPLEIIPNPQVAPDKEHTVQAGMIGWSVIVARILHFPDGTKKEERRKVTYKPKARRVEVHPCRVPEGEKGYTGERCPEPEEEPEVAASASP